MGGGGGGGGIIGLYIGPSHIDITALFSFLKSKSYRQMNVAT